MSERRGRRGTYCYGMRVNRQPRAPAPPSYPPSELIINVTIILAGDGIRRLPRIDYPAAERAAADLLRALGVNPVEEVPDGPATEEG